MNTQFIPLSGTDAKKRGWDTLDIIIITGDAYVDHPSYGAAVISRVLENAGYRVGIIAQPDWRSTDDFKRLGRPQLFFGITSGNVDSMVAHYTANKRPRNEDSYSPGGESGLRPDRAVTVYANRVREVFGDVPIVLGGLEASMRRLAHYDYWGNSVRRSLLLDARGDILVYGMGETQILEIARRLKRGDSIRSLDTIAGTAVVRKEYAMLGDHIHIPSFEEVKEDTKKFNEAFRVIYDNQNPFRAKPVVQKHGDRYVICFPPPLPKSTEALDAIHELPYTRRWHPAYDAAGGVPGFETVRFSLISHRGCCGECSFCSLYFHQGRIIQSRSPQSILREAQLLSGSENFKGTITDIGGPTANLYAAACPRWEREGFCEKKRCLIPGKCKNLDPGFEKSIALYRKLRRLPGVKHVFIGSGFRHDLLTDESCRPYLKEICEHHISGRMKVAPEHMIDSVLQTMGKPDARAYGKFVGLFTELNRTVKQKRFLVNYFISSHPGATLRDALNLALYLIDRGVHPEQIQDFIPLPLTLSGCIYYTGTHPFTGKAVYTAKTFRERKLQRALIQYRNASNRDLIRQALRELKAEHLLGKFFHKETEFRKRTSGSKGTKSR